MSRIIRCRNRREISCYFQNIERKWHILNLFWYLNDFLYYDFFWVIFIFIHSPRNETLLFLDSIFTYFIIIRANNYLGIELNIIFRTNKNLPLILKYLVFVCVIIIKYIMCSCRSSVLYCSRLISFSCFYFKEGELRSTREK